MTQYQLDLFGVDSIGDGGNDVSLIVKYSIVQQCGIVIAWSSLGGGADTTCPCQTRTHTIYNKKTDCT